MLQLAVKVVCAVIGRVASLLHPVKRYPVREGVAIAVVLPSSTYLISGVDPSFRSTVTVYIGRRRMMTV